MLKSEMLQAKYGRKGDDDMPLDVRMEPAEETEAENPCAEAENGMPAPAEHAEPDAVEHTDGSATANDDAAAETSGKENTAEAFDCQKIMDALNDQAQTILSLKEQLTEMERRASASSAREDSFIQILRSIDALKEGAARQEKANTDILRSSKNYQASVQESMQKELERYRKIFSDTAQAPLLTEIANLYVKAQRAIGYVEDEKNRRQLTGQILETIEELLEDQGVEISSSKIGQARSMKRCKTIKTVPTKDKTLHGMVARSYSPSFALGSLVLIKENIETYVFDEEMAAETQGEAPLNAADVNPLNESSEGTPPDEIGAESAGGEEKAHSDSPDAVSSGI